MIKEERPAGNYLPAIHVFEADACAPGINVNTMLP
jgi:hypothetical protein